jgi:flagellar protein FlaG
MPIMGGNFRSENQERVQQMTQQRTQERAQVHAASLARFTKSLPGNGGRSVQTEAALAHLEKLSLSINKKLKFVVNHESNMVMVNVIDANTNKVIKVLPPEELQRLSDGSLVEAGALFDEMA